LDDHTNNAFTEFGLLLNPIKMCSRLQAKEVKTPPLEPEEDTSRDLSLWCLQT